MDLSGVLSGGVAGSLHIDDDGDKIEVAPVLTSGEKIATITINEGTEDEEVIDLYAPEGFSGSWNDLTDKPTLFSGVYGDLTSKPTLNSNTINGNMYTDLYSSNEQRVGTWVNGKPLYQKTIEFTVVGNNNYQRYDHGIDNIDIIFLDQSASFVYYGDSTYPLIGYGGTVQSSQMAVLVWSGGFDYRAGVECNGATCYATLKYTKSTDSI